MKGKKVKTAFSISCLSGVNITSAKLFKRLSAAVVVVENIKAFHVHFSSHDEN